MFSDAEIEKLADETERGYDVDELKTRRRGRPMLASAPSQIVAVQLDPELNAPSTRAEESCASGIIREALRRYLQVAGASHW